MIIVTTVRTMKSKRIHTVKTVYVCCNYGNIFYKETINFIPSRLSLENNLRRNLIYCLVAYKMQ